MNIHVTEAGWEVLRAAGAVGLAILLSVLGAAFFWCMYRAYAHLRRLVIAEMDSAAGRKEHITVLLMWKAALFDVSPVLQLGHDDWSFYRRALAGQYGGSVRKHAKRLECTAVMMGGAVMPDTRPLPPPPPPPPRGGSGVMTPRSTSTDAALLDTLRNLNPGGQVQVYAEDGRLLLDTSAPDPLNPEQPPPLPARRGRARLFR